MCVESRHALYPLKRPIPEWETISCRKQERELVCNYDYMPNSFQCGKDASIRAWSVERGACEL